MPANFLTADQQRHYGCYADTLTPQQLGRYFHLDDSDRQLIGGRERFA